MWKNEDRLCPLPYEEDLEAIINIRPFGQNNVGISKNWDTITWGKLH